MNPLITLSRELVARGHKVTFFHDADMEACIRQHGLNFFAITAPGRCSGKRAPTERQEKPSSAIPLLRYRIHRTVNDMERFLRETPQGLVRTGVEALIVDELALAGPTIAEIVRLPYFIISTSVPHNFGWSAPRPIRPSKSFFTRVQSALLEVSVLQMKGPVRRRLDTFRRHAGLGPIRQIKATFPELAHITQLPRCLDFPRSALPSTFHYTGPFVDDAARLPVDFPWEQLDGRPLIYASLGTTLKSEADTFHLIAQACDGLGVQLVISLGGRRDPEMFRDLPGTPLIVRDAPQLELLKRAEVVITHAGPNTVFESLMQGKPMIAIPKTFDQPAIAARLAWVRAAIVLRPDRLSAEKIRVALSTVLGDPSYRNAAHRMQVRIRSARGLERAADLIEQALKCHAGSSGHAFEAEAAHGSNR
ncbi:MAG TPA: glycosyltransferase [Terracidiphilus sp.]|nr:glycosyltransferase [Terracidiphilus sp.]